MELRLLLITHVLGLCLGLREVRIQVPAAVRKGDNATLHCLYNTDGGDPLYIVKWYKAGSEFYHYAPKEKPPIKTFPVGSLKVIESLSNETQVSLEGVSMDAAGGYSCEVSADAPSFQTATVYGYMDIVELPTKNPSINGMKSKYSVGDTVRVDCTSGLSKPPANLTWFINDNQANYRHVKTTTNSQDSNELNGPRSHLQFHIDSQHFQSGKLKIRCSAAIYDIYWKSTELSAEENKPKLVHFEPAATIVGINYLQPPPNFQTGQKKPDGQADVKVIGSSAIGLQASKKLLIALLPLLRLTFTQ